MKSFERKFKALSLALAISIGGSACSGEDPPQPLSLEQIDVTSVDLYSFGDIVVYTDDDTFDSDSIGRFQTFEVPSPDRVELDELFDELSQDTEEVPVLVRVGEQGNCTTYGSDLFDPSFEFDGQYDHHVIGFNEDTGTEILLYPKSAFSTVRNPEIFSYPRGSVVCRLARSITSSTVNFSNWD